MRSIEAATMFGTKCRVGATCRLSPPAFVSLLLSCPFCPLGNQHSTATQASPAGPGARTIVNFYLDAQCTQPNTILYGGLAQLRGRDGQCSNADYDTRVFYGSQMCGSTPCFPSIYLESPCVTASPATYPPALLAICPTQTPTLAPYTAAPAYPSSDGAACSFDIVFYRQTTDCRGVVLQSFLDVKFDTCLHDYLTGVSIKWTRGWGVISAIYYDDPDCRMIDLRRYYQGVFTISDGQCSERNLIDSRLFRDYGGAQYPLSV